MLVCVVRWARDAVEAKVPVGGSDSQFYGCWILHTRTLRGWKQTDGASGRVQKHDDVTTSVF